MTNLPLHVNSNVSTPRVVSEIPVNETRDRKPEETGVLQDNEPRETRNLVDEKERDRIEKSANAIFDGLNTGFTLKFHEKSGEWYAVVENKITKEVVKEVPPKYVLDLHAKLREMVGFFLDKKI
ncbi:flagellar protein FlaG [Aneurinibacillus tyrosinisolvens]|uniref:flagellar protein FlaG n=1 Tax=Aneurinibacillus tyrosinisolvens TaxID=1443435 RepID=UPI00063F8416|nr:flagellar protein FlaG [Aneurinibacillus tyrosinisolvens]